MSDIAVRVEGLSKRYRLGQPEPYKTLRNALMNGLRAPFRRKTGSEVGSRKSQRIADREASETLTTATAGNALPESEISNLNSGISASPAATSDFRPPTSDFGSDFLWALRDVSFDVRRGEVVGIIGRNGAGKSTLLKILSRITDPTTGRAVISGRVGSLLEVGTGFHPELTGRENIFLNGAILGMRRREIETKFDEIVAFAELERFIDTPVKRYSSGMYMRLAFAVAAHFEPEILIVDEVLAVGDAAFQKKCLGKMGDVARQGRTVLFVSHNMNAVASLCAAAMLLDHGSIAMKGRAPDVINAYLGHGDSTGLAILDDLRGRPTSELRITAVSVCDSDGRPSATIRRADGCTVQIDYEVVQRVPGAQLAIELWREDGACVMSTTDLDFEPHKLHSVRDLGQYRASCTIGRDFLRHGAYRLRLGSSLPGNRMLDAVEDAIRFNVVDDDSVELKLGQGRAGVIAPVLKWDTVSVGNLVKT